MKRRDFCKGLAVTLAAGTLAPAAALPQAGAATALVGRAVPDDYYTLWYRSDRCGADLRHDYYYSDSLFDHPAMEYDNQLALATLGMAAAADCPWESDQRYWMEGEVGRADHIRDAFAKLGFTGVQLFNYTHSLNDTPDTVGCAIARKTLVRGGRQVTIIGAFLRGSGYGAEWSGNLHAGPGSAHTGFVTAARQLVEKIRAYVQASAKRQPLGTLKLWMGGYSRGGGVANLVAARLPAVLPQLEKKNTFVYTFAAPAALTAADCPELQQDFDNNHAADGRLKKNWGTSNIFNIVSSGDVVPRVLPAEWGFYRNGNDRFLPSTVIPEELEILNDRSTRMEGTPIDFGRLAVTEEADAVLRPMMELFCDRQTYYEDYEDAMRCMLQCANTRTEEEVTRGIVRDDAAVVAQLRSMELMQRFPQEKVERCVQAASALSRPVLEKLGVVCGVSSPFTNLYDANHAWFQASAALQNGLSQGGTIFRFQDYLLPQLLSGALAGRPTWVYYTEGLKRLKEHDDNSQVSYLHTLRVYLDNNLSVTKTASALFLHRSTLLDRLAHITAMLGSDLKDPDYCLTLGIILRAELEQKRTEQGAPA